MSIAIDHTEFQSKYSFFPKLEKRARFALQPIVNIHTGTAYGYEGLLRGHDSLGFDTVHQLLDFAFQQGYLDELELMLQKILLKQFSELPFASEVVLFSNLDLRAIKNESEHAEKINVLLKELDLDPSQICFEITEIHDLSSHQIAKNLIQKFHQHGHKLAIDDYGTGFSGLKQLYEYPPDIIKIDRFFISDITKDYKKKLFVSHAVDLAHVMGIKVVAEGIETEDELLTCKSIGCDLAQEYWIDRPRTEHDEISRKYPRVEQAVKATRRETNAQIIRKQMDMVPPLRWNDSFGNVCDTFRRYKERDIFPVINKIQHPIGIINEINIKPYIYSDFGRDLQRNPTYIKKLSDLVQNCPTADINDSPERILEIYANSDQSAGIIITEDSKYQGFITASSLLRMLEKRNLAAARDQNPLTRLPGNNSILEYIDHTIENREESCGFIYFDFNNFKPFNDTYGFRQGDRAIILFADLMRKHFGGLDIFCGHIGGDDFFAGFMDQDIGNIVSRVTKLLNSFTLNMESFYDSVSRDQGFLGAKDRNGVEIKYSLMSCCAAIIELPDKSATCSADELTYLMTNLKKQVKNSSDNIAVKTVSQTLHDIEFGLDTKLTSIAY